MELPQNLDAERFTLGGILMDDSTYIQADGALKPDDFSLEKHRRIFARMGDLHARGEKIDRVTLANELMRHGELESCDGVGYVVSLDDGLPQIYNLESYFRIVKDKSILRKIIYTADHMQKRARVGAEDPAEILASGEQMFRSLNETAERSRVELGSDLLSEALAFAEQRKKRWDDTKEPVIGIASGLVGLDELLGGFNPGLHILAGGPGVGKTSFSLQIAIRACRHGNPAVYVSYENSPANLMIKAICAHADIAPSGIERGNAHSLAFKKFREAGGKLAPALSKLSIIQGSMSLQASTIERAVIEASRRHRSMCILVFDYLQRAAWGEKYNEVRHNVSSLASKLRDVANRVECPVLALCSQNRAAGSYGNGRGSAALDSLKESGDLEYSADTVMFLLPDGERHVADKEVALNLSIAKNRQGALKVLPIVFRPDLGKFAEQSSEA